MLKKLMTLFLVMILLSLTSQLAMAFELVEDQGESTTLGIGYEGSLYYTGVTIAYNITENITGQVVVGIPHSYVWGSLEEDQNINSELSYAGKLMFRFIKSSENNAYIFGMLGSFANNSSRTFGGGVGLGVELSYVNIPNLVCFSEVGYSTIDLPDTIKILLNYGTRIYF